MSGVWTVKPGGGSAAVAGPRADVHVPDGSVGADRLVETTSPLARLAAMWRQSVREVFPGAGLREPVGASEIVEAERRLGRALPTDLEQLLSESDGVLGHSHVDTVWTLDRIVEQNLRFWSDETFAQLYMSFDALLFFGDNGGGDQFAFVQKPQRPDVFVWEHESDSRRWVANDLRDYLGRSLRVGGDDWYRL